ncbi:MAG: hypothetical protein IJ944_00450 [Clostridia bacterium]|nr:hypothetical protein [Clostridia bacterium]
MAKNMSFVLLFDLYGKLLSPRQYEAFDLYYNEDLSLGELAEILGVTRQGVLDNIRTAEKKLLDYEEKLGFAKKQNKYSLIIAEILETIDNNPPSKEVVSKIREALISFD